MNKIFTCLVALSLATGTSALAQQPGAVIDVQHYRFAITLNDQNNNIKGQATVTTRFLKQASKFELDFAKKGSNGKGMTVTALKENGRPVAFSQDSDKLIVNARAKAGSSHTYTITYNGIPSDGLIISTNKHKHRTFFGDNWPNRGHNWLPLVDHPADKASVEFIVTAPAHYQVVANGLKTEERTLAGGRKLTHWKETAQLPTKVMVIGVADFAIKKAGNAGPTPIYTYVFPEDRAPGFKNYGNAVDVLPFFTKNIGPYPYKKLANVQSKTIFGGMENAGAIFYYEESVNDPHVEGLLAHEIAHQWFGDAVSEKNWWHVWLSEGFATYMTNLYLEDKYGADTLKARQAEDRKAIFDYEKRYKAPVVDSAYTGKLMNILSTNAYQKGGWVLHMLRRKIGDRNFWTGIRAYVKKYNGGNANTDDFRRIMEQVSGQDLKQFFNQWLRTAGHPELHVTRIFDANGKVTSFKIEQRQEQPFRFTLQYTIGGKLYTQEITGKLTTILVPAGVADAAIAFDPQVDLLASFTIE